MRNVTAVRNGEFGEIRIGIDKENPPEIYVSLALNHFEDDEQWGGQPLSPKLARHIGSLLIEYAAKADEIQQNEII